MARRDVTDLSAVSSGLLDTDTCVGADMTSTPGHVVEEQVHIGKFEFDNALATHLAIISDDSHSVSAIIDGITSGVLEADKAIDYLLPLSKHDPSDVIKVCDCLLDLPHLNPKGMANTVDVKASALRRLGEYETALTLCTQSADRLQHVSPYAAGLLLCEAGSIAQKDQQSPERAYLFFNKARTYVDPRQHDDVRPENYGYASYEAASALLSLGRAEEARALVNETLATLNGRTTWVSALTKLRHRCSSTTVEDEL